MDTAQTSEQPVGSRAGRGPFFVLDVFVGASSMVMGRTASMGRRASRAVGRVVGVQPHLRVEDLLDELARRGEQEEVELKVRLTTLGDDVLRGLVGTVLNHIDLTETVRQYVDVNRIVADVDIEAVITRLDLPGLAEGVIAEVDLAEIIRQSSGSLTSETVQGARMQGISGDDAIDKAAGRIRVRFSRKHAPAGSPAEP